VDISRHLDETEREIVAERLRAELRTRYSGEKKRFYVAAKVNAETPDKALDARVVRPSTILRIVNALWPEAGGEWDQVPGPRNPSSLDATTPAATAAIAEVERIVQLEARVARLEAHLGLSEIPPAVEVSSSEPLALGGTHLDDPQEAQRRG